MDRQLRLELSNPPLRCRQLCLLGGRQTDCEASIDSCLPPPRIDRLFANPEVGSDLSHLPATFDQLHHTTPELRRVAPPCHIVPLHDYGSGVQ